MVSRGMMFHSTQLDTTRETVPTINASPLPSGSTVNPENQDCSGCVAHTMSYDEAMETLSRVNRELEVLLAIVTRLGRERRDMLVRLQCADCPGYQM